MRLYDIFTLIIGTFTLAYVLWLMWKIEDLKAEVRSLDKQYVWLHREFFELLEELVVLREAYEKIHLKECVERDLEMREEYKKKEGLNNE